MMSKFFMILLICLMMVSMAMAKEAPTVTRIEPADFQNMTILTPPGDGIVGNLNAPVYSVAPWFTGGESYKYFFDPSEQLPNCAVGFQLISIHMYLEFDDTMNYPIDFPVYGDLETAVWDDELGCYIPGPEECVGPLVTFTVDQPGGYNFEVPMDCTCAYKSNADGTPFMYMLSMHFPVEFTAKLITDDTPVGCTSWNNWGDGWFDLVNDFNFPGEVSMYGDVLCCSDPVGVEVDSWGDIKSMFR